MSSSTIGTYRIPGNRGPTGPTGARGATGATGNTGATGATGSYGLYVLSAISYVNGVTLIMTDGSLRGVSGNFRGATSDFYASDIQSITTGFSIVSSYNNTTGLLNIKGMTATGSLFLTQSDNYININSTVAETPSELDISNLVNNTLIYLVTPSKISSTSIGVSYDNNSYQGTLVYDALGNQKSRLNASYKTKYVGPVQREETPIYLNTDIAGVFYLNTPIGIAGITGTFRNNETISITIIPADENIWYFPENVYFEEGENYLTCGKSIINLLSVDAGKTWLATVAARGFDVNSETCDISNTLGSCCYANSPSDIEELGSLSCLDYTNKETCDSLFGTFNPLSSCEISCGVTGVCCTNGKCIENVSPSECFAFGGRFFGGITCGAYGNDPEGTNDGTRLCPNLCETTVQCCVDGQSIGTNYTKYICEKYFNGIAVPIGENCCDYGVGVGPCCTPSGCSEKNKVQCDEDGGIYMGEGLRCDQINCDCVSGVPIGSCCNSNTCVDGKTRVECNSSNGTFSTLTCEQRGNCQTNPTGSCCLQSGVCLDNITQSNCTSQSGSFSITPCNQRNCSDQVGACCVFSNDPFYPPVDCIPNLTKTQCENINGSCFRPNESCDGLNSCFQCQGPCCPNWNTGDANCLCYDTTYQDCIINSGRWKLADNFTECPLDTDICNCTCSQEDPCCIDPTSCACNSNQPECDCVGIFCGDTNNFRNLYTNLNANLGVYGNDGGGGITDGPVNNGGGSSWNPIDPSFANFSGNRGNLQGPCEFSENCCYVEFDYCKIDLVENEWKPVRQFVQRKVCTAKGNPTVPCESLQFDSCSDTRNKFKKLAKCCLAKNNNCPNADSLCFGVDTSDYCDEMTNEKIFDYLKKFCNDTRNWNDLSETEKSSFICNPEFDSCQSIDCSDCCSEPKISQMERSDERKNTSVPLPGTEDANIGFKIAYRSCISGICKPSDYSYCDPLCSRFIDPCCSEECSQLSSNSCKQCTVYNNENCSKIYSDPIFYAKIVINNEDVCVPIICEDCSEYEACES